MGIRRYTASREKDETEAMLPVEKKADCSRYSSIREVRMLEVVRVWVVRVEVFGLMRSVFASVLVVMVPAEGGCFRVPFDDVVVVWR